MLEYATAYLLKVADCSNVLLYTTCVPTCAEGGGKDSPIQALPAQIGALGAVKGDKAVPLRLPAGLLLKEADLLHSAMWCAQRLNLCIGGPPLQAAYVH